MVLFGTFASMVATRFTKDVREWVEGLSPEQRATALTPENARLVAGDVWKSVAEKVPPGRCPFPGLRR